MSYTLPFRDADRIIREGLAAGDYTAASLLIGKGERVLFRNVYGRLGMEEDSPETDWDTRYDMASVTKILGVGTLCLLALEEGRICLWDTLPTFFDNVPEDKENISIGHLLTHTSGLPDSTHLWLLTDDPNQVTQTILHCVPLRHAPGEAEEYTCIGFILLGKLLEKVYGKTLDVLAREKVFEPLEMTSTGYLPNTDNVAATEMQDDGHCLQGIVHDENAQFLRGVSGNAGIFSTLDDMAKYVRMLARWGLLLDGRRFLAKRTLEAAFTNRTVGMAQGRGLAFYLPRYDNGYIGDLFSDQSIGHTGFTGTSFTLDPASGLYVILLTNRVCPSRDSQGIYRVRRLVHNVAVAAAERF